MVIILAEVDILFVVSDNDMPNRYEQTMLMLGTLTHFGYKNFSHEVRHGRHCEHCAKIDENGESVFGKMIYSFIEKNIDGSETKDVLA